MTKITMQTTISAAVSASKLRQASNGNNDSGTWSRPLARLLDGRPSRRLQKLEKRSPAIAKLPTRSPVVQPRPMSGAPAVVATTASTTPRIVFERPNTGRPSANVRLPSSG
jgi:hypothetical protein